MTSSNEQWSAQLNRLTTVRSVRVCANHLHWMPYPFIADVLDLPSSKSPGNIDMNVNILDYSFEEVPWRVGRSWPRSRTRRFCRSMVLYSASQKKRNQEVSMFYHNLITTIINEWYIFGKLRVSSFSWCYSRDAHFTHEWLTAIWRKETEKWFGGRYLNFKEKIHISRKFIFCSFIWYLNQEKWARNNKVPVCLK